MSELDLEVVVRPDRYQAVQRPGQDYVPAAQPSSTRAELAGHPRDAAGGAAHGGGARGALDRRAVAVQEQAHRRRSTPTTGVRRPPRTTRPAEALSATVSAR